MLIKSTRTLTLRSDGTFTYVEAGTNTGARVYHGTYTQQGSTLTFTDPSGRTLTLRYELRGNNGLVLGGVLFQRQ